MSHIQAKHDLYAKQKSRLSYSFVWAQTMSVFCLESSEIMKPLKAINCFCTCSPSRTKLKALEDSAATFYPVSNVYVCFSLTIVFEVNCDMFMCLWYQRWFTEGELFSIKYLLMSFWGDWNHVLHFHIVHVFFRSTEWDENVLSSAVKMNSNLNSGPSLPKAN